MLTNDVYRNIQDMLTNYIWEYTGDVNQLYILYRHKEEMLTSYIYRNVQDMLTNGIYVYWNIQAMSTNYIQEYT